MKVEINGCVFEILKPDIHSLHRVVNLLNQASGQSEFEQIKDDLEDMLWQIEHGVPTRPDTSGVGSSNPPNTAGKD